MNRSSSALTCTGCSLLCHDLQYERTGDDVKLNCECEKGKRWIESRLAFTKQCDSSGGCLVDGERQSLQAGIELATDLIKNSKLPVVFGLVAVSSETQRSAVRLAREMGAVVDWSLGGHPYAVHRARQQIGEVSCTLGELRDRADLIILWGVNPEQTHPRFFERFVDQGQSSPKVVRVERQPGVSVRGSLSISLKDLDHFKALRVLFGILSGKTHVSDESKTSAEATRLLVDLASLIKQSRYCVIVFEESLSRAGGCESVGLLYKTVRAVNDVTNCRIIELAPFCNSVGAKSVMSWITGYPFAVGFRRGDADPQFRPGEYSLGSLLESRTADLLIQVGASPLDARLSELGQSLDKIVFRDDPAMAAVTARVVFEIPPQGSNGPQTMFRVDGIPVKTDSGQSLIPSFDEISQRIIDAWRVRVRA